MDTNEIIRDWDFSMRIAGLFMETINPMELRKTGYKWLERVKSLDETQHKPLRGHILKLMLLSLQNNRLVGPFKREPPGKTEKLEEMFCHYKSSQITSKVMNEALADVLTSEPLPPLPISTGCYTIMQLIPKYGGHFYDTSSFEAIKCSNDVKNRDLPLGTSFIFPAYCTRNLYYPENDTGGIGRLLGKLAEA